MVKISAIPIFNDNYIWLFHHEASRFAWVVDPGLATPVMSYCKRNDLTLKGILITHHHQDHTGGINDLLREYNVPVYGPRQENIPGKSHPLHKGDTVSLSTGNFSIGDFSILEVPGHTLGHIAYFNNTMANHPILFVGDTLFSAGCGRLFEGTATMMFESLNKLKQLPTDTLIFCTHEYTLANIKFAMAVEPDNSELINYKAQVEERRKANIPSLPTTLAQEKRVNPFLRTSQSAVIKNVSTWANAPLHTELEVFTALRRWKDEF